VTLNLRKEVFCYKYKKTVFKKMPTVYSYVLGRPKAQQEIVEIPEETPVETPVETTEETPAPEAPAE
jgi:hypothetical protein